MMKEQMTLTFPLRSGFLTTVRLATGGVCSLAGLDLDASEDCKVCVTESLLILKRNGYRAAELSFISEGGLRVRVHGFEKEAGVPSEEDDISYALLGALVKDLALERQGDCVSAIGFAFGS